MTDKEILGRCTRSNTAIRRGVPNVPSSEQTQRILWIYKNIFLPIKTELDPSADISSCFRSVRVNKLVGGSSTSQHMFPLVKHGKVLVCTAGAIDINFRQNSKIMAPRVKAFLNKKGIAWDQIIMEYPDSDDGGWVHVSHGFTIPNRKEFFRIG